MTVLSNAIVGMDPVGKSVTALYTLGTKAYLVGKVYTYARAGGNLTAAANFDLTANVTSAGSTYTHELTGGGNVLVLNDYFWAVHRTSTL